MDIGKKIQQLRKVAKITQVELSVSKTVCLRRTFTQDVACSHPTQNEQK
jgi:hypothetical protein